MMSTIELEVQKAELVREILNETNEDIVQGWMQYFFKTRDKAVRQSEQTAIKTHLASEYVLAKDWLNPQEDEAWKDL
jgi:hypothetical protein